jgi:hypothetical protein
MKTPASYKIPFLLILGAASAFASFAACGGGSTAAQGTNTGTNTDTDAGQSSVSTTAGTCTTATVGISFSPMYSAYIPGSTAHTFQIPAVTTDGTAATWSVSDPTQAQLAAQTFDDLPGVMITVQGAGTNGSLQVIATKADGSCGTASLNITSTTEDNWQIGSSRYNDGVALHIGPPDGGFDFEGGRPEGGTPGGPRLSDGGSFFEVDGGTACTNCHGPTATSGPYKDVSHTPEQTGGFSDDELIAIITTGVIPDGGYFDPTVLDSRCDGGAACTARAFEQWHSFHQWTDITSDQYPGIIAYLRSLQPAAQAGQSNFGGRPRRDGGGPPPPSGDQ